MEMKNKLPGSIIAAIAAGVCFGLVLARFVPELVDLQPSWWFALGVLFALKPLGSRLFSKSTTP